MGDVTSATSIAPNAPAAPNLPAPAGSTDADKALEQQAERAELELPQRLADNTAREEKFLGEQQEQIRQFLMKPPKMETPEAPDPVPPDPIKAWSSSTMMLAMLGSMFTRTPMLTALSAATGVMKAYGQGNQDKMNYEVMKWKVATENARTAYQYEMDSYKAILGNLYDNEKLIMDLSHEEREDIMSSVQALESAFNNRILLEQKDLQSTIAVMHATDQHAEAQQKVEKEGEILAEIAAMKMDPNFQKMSPQDQMAAMIGKGQGTEIAEKLQMQAINTFNHTVEGKAASVAGAANDTIQSLYQDSEVRHNPASQITLLDKYIYLATGSVRPALAQYAKLIDSKTGQDRIDLITDLLQHHPILGRDMINDIAHSAAIEARSARKVYVKMLMTDLYRNLAEQSGALPPLPAIEKLQRFKGTPQEAQARRDFDQHFGEGTADGILGD